MEVIGDERVEFLKLRMIDFFFLFPHLLQDLSFPRESNYSGLKKDAKKLSSPYENLPDKKRLFSELYDFQIQAIHILTAKKIFSMNDNYVSKGAEFVNPMIQSLLNDNFFLKQKIYVDLIHAFLEMSLIGDAGLKKRTGLMESRYDAF